MKNKGCSDKEFKIIHCGCGELQNVDFSEGCGAEILVVGNSKFSGIIQDPTDEIKNALMNIKDVVPVRKIVSITHSVKLAKEFKEKPQKRNFVNKFNKNQHRK